MFVEVKYYQPEEEFDPAKCDQYCKTLKEHLQKRLREEEDCLKRHLADLASRTVQPLRGMTTNFTTIILSDVQTIIEHHCASILFLISCQSFCSNWRNMPED